jgi:hypothetical protein
VHHAGFQEILRAQQSRHEIGDRADECWDDCGQQPVVDNERLVTLGCWQGGVDHLLSRQGSDVANLGWEFRFGIPFPGTTGIRNSASEFGVPDFFRRKSKSENLKTVQVENRSSGSDFSGIPEFRSLHT